MRAARFYMAAQVETGHLCPITMTRAALAALAAEPSVAAKVVPKVLTRNYDAAFAPFWEKSGMTLGMGMTENQGGTDVRANTTKATPSGDAYSIVGAKWFMSAPMSDAFLVLAQAPGGLTCFLMPRFRPDGSVNALRFQRLKDKLGNRSNASSEVEFTEAFAWRIGEEGAGIRTILQMVQLTRLDCAVASAGLMRMALAQAVHHCRYRNVFQKPLYDQPMMRTVLADLALEMEGVVALVMRLCRALDRAAEDAREAAYARLITPAAKFLICKIAPAFVFEAMECLGGNGYVEESIMPRLYREAPVNAIWEGSGNVMCLDVLRALRGEEERSLFRTLAHDAGVEVRDLNAEEPPNEAYARMTVRTAGAVGERGGAASERAAAGGGSVCAFAARGSTRHSLRHTTDRSGRGRFAATARPAGALTVALLRLQIGFRQPFERALKDVDGGVLVDHLLALGAADIDVDQRALDCGGREPLVPERDRQLGLLREIAREGACRLGARALAAVHVDGQAEHEAGRAPLGGEDKYAGGIDTEFFADDGFDRRRHAPVRIARSDADGFGTEIEADQARPAAATATLHREASVPACRPPSTRQCHRQRLLFPVARRATMVCAARVCCRGYPCSQSSNLAHGRTCGRHHAGSHAAVR